jgi:hypothetical protein
MDQERGFYRVWRSKVARELGAWPLYDGYFASAEEALAATRATFVMHGDWDFHDAYVERVSHESSPCDRHHPGMNRKEHRARHVELHHALDELVADFVLLTKQTLSGTDILSLMKWSHAQTKDPTEDPPTHPVIEAVFDPPAGEAP